MRKVIYFATALTVVMSSFPSLASAAPGGAFRLYDETGDQVVPREEHSKLDFGIRTDWEMNSSAPNYVDHPSDAPKELPIGGNVTFNSEAYLDMVPVSDQWYRYLASQRAQTFLDLYGNFFGGTPEEQHNALIESVDLRGEWQLSIKCDSVISNKGADTYFDWVTNEKGFDVDDYFVQEGSTQYDAATNTLSWTMRTKNEDPELNQKLDTYFETLKAARAAGEDLKPYQFLLHIDSDVIDTSSAGTYTIEGNISGEVTITQTAYTDTPIKLGTVYYDESDDTEYIHIAGESTPTATPTATPYVRRTGGGSSSSTHKATAAPTTEPTPEVTPTPVPEDKIQNVTNSRGASLNTEDHYAYIIGYPLEDDQTIAEVRPQAGITRAEVATIFFRMLTDESRTRFWTTTNSFSDVPRAEWYNNAISTALNAGIIEGYAGLFRPDDPITRAEFATIAARFSSLDYNGEDKFTDISSHWAKDNINKAAETGWIQGDGDGRFRPDSNITRAEAMTLVNRMLYRLVAVSGLEEEGMLTWIDNLDKSAWYYPAVQEATNSHDYDRIAIGHSEDWTRTKTPRDWEALEKTYSTPTSAGTEDSIFEDSDYEELNTEQ